MNDLVTPFFVVFLCELTSPNEDVEVFDVAQLSLSDLHQIEADSYWCMSKLLDGIQDNYTFAQPGIQAKVNTLRILMQRVDSEYKILTPSEPLIAVLQYLRVTIFKTVPFRPSISVRNNCCIVHGLSM